MFGYHYLGESILFAGSEIINYEILSSGKAVFYSKIALDLSLTAVIMAMILSYLINPNFSVRGVVIVSSFVILLTMFGKTIIFGLLSGLPTGNLLEYGLFSLTELTIGGFTIGLIYYLGQKVIKRLIQLNGSQVQGPVSIFS